MLIYVLDFLYYFCEKKGAIGSDIYHGISRKYVVAVVRVRFKWRKYFSKVFIECISFSALDFVNLVAIWKLVAL